MDNNVLISLVSLSLIIIGHLCTTVWWMSKITEKLAALERAFTDIAKIVREHESVYMKQADCYREITKLETQINAIWGKIDAQRTV